MDPRLESAYLPMQQSYIDPTTIPWQPYFQEEDPKLTRQYWSELAPPYMNPRTAITVRGRIKARVDRQIQEREDAASGIGLPGRLAMQRRIEEGQRSLGSLFPRGSLNVRPVPTTHERRRAHSRSPPRNRTQYIPRNVPSVQNQAPRYRGAVAAYARNGEVPALLQGRLSPHRAPQQATAPQQSTRRNNSNNEENGSSCFGRGCFRRLRKRWNNLKEHGKRQRWWGGRTRRNKKRGP